MNVTMIGLGNMGQAMAERILLDGHTLTVYNRSPEKMVPLVEQGARGATSIADAVKQAEVVLSCLFDDAALTEVCQSSDGLIANLPHTAVHVSTATIRPASARLIAQAHSDAGKHYVSGAVLGIPDVARQGKMLSFCAGEAAQLPMAKTILHTFCEEVVDLGQNPEAPLVMKIGLNYVLITNLELISELYVFFEKSGVDPSLMQDGLHRVFAHPGYKRYVDKIKDRDFDRVNFNMHGGLKDVSVFQQAFIDVGVVPALADLVKGRFVSALAQGMEHKDWSGIYEVIRKESGL
jgi:3-hydroxyisobutyrate dehydrogenase-like beta-hydroxyacid dehydrogenase